MKEYELIELLDVSYDMCALPNGNFIFANYLSKNLCIYDANYLYIKYIDKISNQVIKPFNVVTNNKNRIYINNDNRDIIMTDLDFNYLDRTKQLKNLSQLIFHEELLYVCERSNNSIAKLNQDLELKARIYIDCVPEKMEILSNLACILTNDSVLFYDTVQLCIKYTYNKCSSVIVYENNFFSLDEDRQNIHCYNHDGVLIDSMRLNFRNDLPRCFNSSVFIRKNNNNILIHHFDNKLVIF